jgi:hypothetical protein
MRDSTLVTASNGELVRINTGDVVRFSYPLEDHETGILKSIDGEIVLIELALVDAGRPVVIERYRTEIIV